MDVTRAMVSDESRMYIHLSLPRAPFRPWFVITSETISECDLGAEEDQTTPKVAGLGHGVCVIPNKAGASVPFELNALAGKHPT